MTESEARSLLRGRAQRSLRLVLLVVAVLLVAASLGPPVVELARAEGTLAALPGRAADRLLSTWLGWFLLLGTWWVTRRAYERTDLHEVVLVDVGEGGRAVTVRAGQGPALTWRVARPVRDLRPGQQVWATVPAGTETANDLGSGPLHAGQITRGDTVVLVGRGADGQDEVVRPAEPSWTLPAR